MPITTWNLVAGQTFIKLGSNYESDLQNPDSYLCYQCKTLAFNHYHIRIDSTELGVEFSFHFRPTVHFLSKVKRLLDTTVACAQRVDRENTNYDG